MTDTEQLIDELDANTLPLFKTSEQMSNMRMDTFTVPQASTIEIQKRFLLPKDEQSRAVGKLVDSRKDWLDLDEAEQLAEIKMKLILETVAQYLYLNDFITEDCTMYDNGFDKHGNIVLRAYYVEETEQGRAVEAAIKKKKAKKKKKVTSLAQYKKKKESTPDENI